MKKIKITFTELADAIGRPDWYRDNEYLDACPFSDIYNDHYHKENELSSVVNEPENLRGIFEALPAQCAWVINDIERNSMSAELTEVRVRSLLKGLENAISGEGDLSVVSVKGEPFFHVIGKGKELKNKDDILSEFKDNSREIERYYELNGERVYPEVDQESFNERIFEIDIDQAEEQSVERIIEKSESNPVILDLCSTVLSTLSGRSLEEQKERLRTMVIKQAQGKLSNIKGLSLVDSGEISEEKAEAVKTTLALVEERVKSGNLESIEELLGNVPLEKLRKFLKVS